MKFLLVLIFFIGCVQTGSDLIINPVRTNSSIDIPLYLNYQTVDAKYRVHSYDSSTTVHVTISNDTIIQWSVYDTVKSLICFQEVNLDDYLDNWEMKDKIQIADFYPVMSFVNLNYQNVSYVLLPLNNKLGDFVAIPVLNGIPDLSDCSFIYNFFNYARISCTKIGNDCNVIWYLYQN